MDRAIDQKRIPPWSDLHFAADDPIVTSVRDYVECYAKPTDGAHILVALSGGPDSVALLTVLHHLAGSMSWSLAAAHVNYHLRGNESDGDETFCRELCTTWGIPLHIHHASYDATRGDNLQAWARSIRYAFFEDLRTAERFDHVAVGHTLDDRAETVAAAVIEARGTFALSGIPPVRGAIMRPLFFAARSAVLEFLATHGVPFRRDSSNETASYLRNRIRHEVLPAWRDLNPSVSDGLARLGEQLWKQETLLFREAERILDDAKVAAESGRMVFECGALAQYDQALDPFVLRLLLRWLCIEDVPSPATVERFARLRQSGVTGHVEQGDLHLECSKGQIVVFTPSHESAPGSITFAAGESFQFGPRYFRSEIVESAANPPYDDNIMALLDLDHLTQPFVMRVPRVGDRYEPYGLGGHKKVADILADRGVPASLRSTVPILADAAGIVWPVGYPIAERAKVTDATRAILRIRVESA